MAQWNDSFFIRDMLEMVFRDGQQMPSLVRACARVRGYHARSVRADWARQWDEEGKYTAKEVGNMVVYAKTNDTFDTFEKQEVRGAP